MSEFQKALAGLGNRVEERLDSLKLRLRKRAGFFRRLQILPYIGYGNCSEVCLTGRVLRESEIRTPLDEEPVWRNIVATYRRFHTVELPGALVRASFEGVEREFRTDREGYFEICLPAKTNARGDLPWQELKLELREPAQKGVKTSARVRIPSAKAQFGIISDIDDTVLVTNANRLARMLLATFLGNARTRTPFAGVGAFYRALESGADNQRQLNPIFYVSSGPWNLYDLLIDFLELNGIPLGPVFLQDYGFDHEKFFKAGHREHKTKCIAKILGMYPNLPFILIGDSGQRDPEIYTEVLSQAPNRILAIYIRQVSGRARGEQVRALGNAARQHGGQLVLVENSYEAGRHAAERGFISAEMLDAIRAEAEADERALRKAREPLPFDG